MSATSRIFLASALALAVAAFCAPDFAAAGEPEGLDPADPMVRITAGKLKLDVPAALAAVGRDVKAATGLGPDLVTYYWQTFDAISLNGKPSADKPLFVDLYVPCFFTPAQTRSMLTALADSLARRTGLEKKWLFIHAHVPAAGQVYIDGHVMDRCVQPSATAGTGR